VSIIKNICQNNAGISEHLQFIRFSKGFFENRFYFKVKNGKKLKIFSGFENVNDLIKIIAENEKELLDIKGKVFSKKDFHKFFENKERKKGFFVGEINKSISHLEFKELYDLFKDEYLLLNIKSNKFSLKTNSSLHNPKGTYKAKFAVLETSDIGCIKDEFLFDIDKNFKEIEIKHDILVTEIIIPDQYKDNPEEARINAKRKGKIVRKINLDGKEEQMEINFLV